MVAAQLFERLRRGEPFNWCPSAQFTPKGLVVRAPKLFGSGEPRRVPYDARLRVSIDQGTCHLFIGNEQKAAMSVECAAHNFYPWPTPPS